MSGWDNHLPKSCMLNIALLLLAWPTEAGQKLLGTEMTGMQSPFFGWPLDLNERAAENQQVTMRQCFGSLMF